MTVKELMTEDVKTCQAGDSLSVPAQLMWEADCGCIPVVDSAMHVVGMITDRDIAMATSLHGAAPGFMGVSAVMTPFAHTCRPADSVELALRIMQTRRVSRLPVTDVDGRLVGILSMHDVVRAAAKARARGAKPSLEEVVRAMAAVCEPRQKTAAAAAGAQPPR